MVKNKTQSEEVPLSEVKLDPEVEQSLKNTESVVGGIYTDLDEVGNMVENMQETVGGVSNAIKALTKQYIKDRKEQEKFNRQIKESISTEVAKQIEPLVKQINNLTKQKPKFIYVLPHFPTLGIWARIRTIFVKEVKK